MKNIVTYEVHMELAGRMTQIPDSQKIFGALIYLYSEYTSQSKATELVQKIKNKELYMAVSDMMPQGYFPLPTLYLIEKASEKGQKNTKRIYKEIKKRNYIKSDKILNILSNNERISDIYPYVHLKQSNQIHASIDSLHYHLDGLDSNIYSVPETIVLKVGKKDGIAEMVSEFCFYLSIEAGELEHELLKMLAYAKEKEKPFFLGQRASQGLNLYRIGQLQKRADWHRAGAESYLNLGMLLPDNLDFEKSYLNIFTSERKPYNQLEGWNKNKKNQFISFISAGSILYFKNNKDKEFITGKSIASPFDGERAIVFGNPVLYPMNVKEGGI
jgi:hypothetical protein